MIHCDFCESADYDLDGDGYHTLFDDEGFEPPSRIPCEYVFSDILAPFFHDATCIHDSYSIECLSWASALNAFLEEHKKVIVDIEDVR